MHSFAFIFLFHCLVQAGQEAPKGLFKELANENNSLESELLITKTEQKAIETLQKLLAKKRGTYEEPDLLYRLAELYVRKSKSGRFFDLQLREGNLKQLSSFPVAITKGADSLKKAITIYSDIENRFPKYAEMDLVYFSHAFALQQINKFTDAEKMYLRLAEKFPSSSLMPDTYIALGELSFSSGRFGSASEYFSQVTKYPESRVYSYALYKRAWSYYNLKNSDAAVKDLIQVVKLNPFSTELIQLEDKRRQNLRKEAMRDLSIFVGETLKATEIYSFFDKLAEKTELDESIDNVANLYFGYSKYQDINILLDEYLNEEKKKPFFIKAHILQIKSYEAQKKRNLVLEHLDQAQSLCQKEWPTDELCSQKLAIETNDLSAKWWDIWKKNQKNKEFSVLTQKALEIKIKYEDTKKPDSTTHFALAEVLFQTDAFLAASAQYHKTSEILIKDPKEPLLHDSLYGAVYSLEKLFEKEKSKENVQRQQTYIENYLKHQPKGKYALDLTLKMGLNYYHTADHANALKWLSPLDNPQAQDIVLDIYNKQGKLAQLEKTAANFLVKEKNPDRQKTLKTLLAETSFAIIQADIKNHSPETNSQTFADYAQKNSGSPLAEEALALAISESFRAMKHLQASVKVLEFYKKYPKNKNIEKFLSESLTTFLLNGKFDSAIEILQHQGNKKALIADLYELDGKHSLARTLFKELGDQDRITNSLKKFGPDTEWKKLKAEFVNRGVEPYATEYLIELAQAKLNSKNYEAAFDQAKKIMGREAPAPLRAKARYIQAQILEQEFANQSLKSSQESRISLVLNLKLEKLEKAQTAYLSVAKMTTDPEINQLAYLGIDRCYENLISGLMGMQAPVSFSEAESKAFKDEITQMIVPIQTKKDENLKLISSKTKGLPSITGTREPRLILPESLPAIESKLLPPIQETGWQAGLHASLAAEKINLHDKALFLTEMSLKLDPKNILLLYNRGRLNLEKIDEVLSTEFKGKELDIFRLNKAILERDNKKALSIITGLRQEDLVRLKLVPVSCEVYALNGDFDSAERLLKNLSKSEQGIEIHLHHARHLEHWMKNPKGALEKYEAALKLAKEPELETWIKGKIANIKSL